jgi:hypothetical protein
MRMTQILISVGLLLNAGQGSAMTQKEILTLCGGLAKESAKIQLLAEPEVAEITQHTTWLSGYEPSEQMMPIFTVLMDYLEVGGGNDYAGFRVTTTYSQPNCLVNRIEKLPL